MVRKPGEKQPEQLVDRIKCAANEGLTELDFSYERMSELPDDISQLCNLRVLDLRHNRLTSLPESIGRLHKLETLFLSYNQLTSLPESIGRLSCLRELYAHHNELSTVPDSIGQLRRLWTLPLSENQLTVLPDSIGQLVELRRLKLDGNQLTTLPDAIGALARVEVLILAANHLTSLPESIGQLTHLDSLDLGGNRLASLPESIGQLVHLDSLDLRENKLTVLPESIGQLACLDSLNLRDNRLSALPESITNLTRLDSLDLAHNPDLRLPVEVLSSGTPNEILDYYFRVRSEEQGQPLNEAKLILVGHGEVGKTSIVNRLIHDSCDKAEGKTEGIQISDWKIELGADETVRLNVWDFGGQEIMHATHQFFLTQRGLYLLVLNGRQGHEDFDAEYWLNLIRSFAEDSPVIVVLNKIKMHPFDLNYGALRQKFPQVRGFIRTDCAPVSDNDDSGPIGIEELRRAIYRETDRLEHLRDAFPTSWFSIKDRLSEMHENYMGFEEYRRICANLGEADENAQDSLAFYLHSLGIALNYKDDPRLRDTHVLNPHWVTEGIYKILLAKSVAEQKGVLCLDDLSKILDRDKYPSKMHGFLFDLMRKFELCFSFPDNDDRYLIPELLDKQQPNEAIAGTFEPQHCLQFQYHYPILPEGLLPRFIVRTHALSVGQPRWRSGVILEFEGNQALVKADVQDRKVIVSIAGPIEGRRRLLSVIRSDFEDIHSTFKFKLQEMIPVPDHPEVLIPYKKLRVMEANGVQTFPEVSGEEVLELDVGVLLNGVDLDGTREHPRDTRFETDGVRLFYSYSREDEEFRNELETHLKIFQRSGLIEEWHDRQIKAGEKWEQEIDHNLEKADIIVLLVSANFVASDYCYEVEMKRAMKLHQAGQACVIPVIVRDVSWSEAPFGKLQALPRDGKAVETWDNRATAWQSVARGIEKVVRDLMLVRQESNCTSS